MCEHDDWGTFTTIPAELRAAAVDAPEVEAIVDGDIRLTFSQLRDEAERFARGLVAHGLAAGDRVMLWAPNSARWIIAAFGVMAAGGILSPINTRFKGAEARYAIDKVRATMLIVDDSFLGNDYLTMVRDADRAAPRADQPISACPSVHSVITLDTVAPADESVTGYDALLADGETVPESEIDARIAAQSPEDVVDILFTSGTTGFPKGAMVTHRSNLLVDLAWCDMAGLRRGDRYLLINPFFHSFGYRAGIFTCLIRRATMVPMAVFDAVQTMSLIERERITVFPGAPTIYTTLLDHPDFQDYDLSSVRLAVTGATIVPVPLIRRMREELGFRTVITAYGLTESTGTSTVCPPDTDEERISTSSGIAIPGVELRIVGAAGAVMPPGERGEIQVRGINVMKGYFEDPEATAAAIDPEGWLHTGDIGWMDAEGYLRITDRIKDVFVVGGFNVYPAEVERVIREHPAVLDVAVIGVPDPRMGEVGSAYVQLRSGATAGVEELIAFCTDKMANYKRPRHIEIVDSLPRTASGKIQKFRLSQQS